MSQGQRRLAAIMFTDMVGYTALGQRNELLSMGMVEEQRKLLRPIFARHSGREIKTIGDAFLVDFPNALDAIRCAYDVQRATREFNISLSEDHRVHLRVGLHLGDVVESQGDISGDAVNLASRIESLAEDGGVCLTRAVYDQVQNKFELRLTSLGMIPLKNVSAPVEVYKMVMPWEAKSISHQFELDRHRVAILPFASLSPDQNDDYFADGVTEELISTISRVKGLRVIARTSAMHYKGQMKRITEIGSELKVGTILEGSVRKSGDKVRISAQLIDVSNEEHIWAEDYERNIEDIFQIQKEIATKIAGELEVKLLPEERRRLDRKDTENPAAYSLYLKGRYFWSERSEEGLKKAKEYFEKALNLDGAFARAYSGLADTYSIMAFQSIMPAQEATTRAKALAEKAIELDNSLAEAHTSLGYILPDLTFNWDGAEKEYQTALELNPSYATAHFWYSIQLLWLGRYGEAIEHARQAEELDPLSPAISTAFGQVLIYSRRYDKAIAHLERKVLTDPNSMPSHFILGIAYFYTGQYERAAEEERKALALSTMQHRAQTILGMALAKLGRKADAMEILGSLQKTSAQRALVAMLQIELGAIEGGSVSAETVFGRGRTKCAKS